MRVDVRERKLEISANVRVAMRHLYSQVRFNAGYRRQGTIQYLLAPVIRNGNTSGLPLPWVVTSLVPSLRRSDLLLRLVR